MSGRPDQPWSRLVSGRRLLQILVAVTGVQAVLGLAVEVWASYQPSELTKKLVQLLSLSYEGNVPTWYASCLLFWCALSLAGIALLAQRRKEPYRWHWFFLAIIFFYLSLDEAVGIHENFGGLVDAGGVLYFDWIVPMGIALAILGVCYVPFLGNLPARTRQRFLLAGALYVGGALMMELPLGYWTSRYGDDNLGYALIDLVEEVLELLGASLFLVALWEYSGNQASKGEEAK